MVFCVCLETLHHTLDAGCLQCLAFGQQLINKIAVFGVLLVLLQGLLEAHLANTYHQCILPLWQPDIHIIPQSSEHIRLLVLHRLRQRSHTHHHFFVQLIQPLNHRRSMYEEKLVVGMLFGLKGFAVICVELVQVSDDSAFDDLLKGLQVAHERGVCLCELAKQFGQ